MFEVQAPHSTESLHAGLSDLHMEIVSFVSELSDREFLEPQGEHWSPAEHLRHLATAVRAVARGMSAPKALLALRFGCTFRGSRGFEEVRELYQAALAAGGQASGPYDPTAREIAGKPDEQRAFVMKRWNQAGGDLDRAIGFWSDRALDRFRARHPLLGMMTIRELLHFTLYHNAHHARRIHERRA
ncbi:MAG: DinB family protein [bacterium]|nr:DinB family protein [bacterium]